MTDKIWTKTEIQAKLENDTNWLERAIVAIYRQQTTDEKWQYDTRYLNSRGFSAADAKYLTYVAKWITNGHHLSGSHIQKARARMMKYAGQLADIANGKISDEEREFSKRIVKEAEQHLQEGISGKWVSLK